MSLLDRFEHSLERLMEGTTGSLFRQSLQPAEIGKKLERAMVAGRQASVGGSLVPNRFIVRLSARDYSQFEDYRDGLARQLEAHLAQFASRQRFAVIERISVSLVEDAEARRRQPVVEASIADSRRGGSAARVASPPAQATAAFSVVSASPRAIALRIVSGAYEGKEFTLAQGTSTLGRSSDNTIVIDSTDVSRRHARFEYSSGRLRVYDLNSTNGTRVNGEAVRIADLEPGDRVAVGGCTLEVRAGSGPERNGRY